MAPEHYAPSSWGFRISKGGEMSPPKMSPGEIIPVQPPPPLPFASATSSLAQSSGGGLWCGPQCRHDAVSSHQSVTASIQ